MGATVYGPRRVGPRRLLSIPRQVLNEAHVEVPSTVAFVIEQRRVLMQPFSPGVGPNGLRVSVQGQVMLPRGVLDALKIDVGGHVYARVSSGGVAVELLPATRVSVTTRTRP